MFILVSEFCVVEVVENFITRTYVIMPDISLMDDVQILYVIKNGITVPCICIFGIVC